MDRTTKRDISIKTVFASLLDDAFRWAATNKKLGENGRHESHFAKLCGTSVKTFRRWVAGANHPKKDSWETAKNGLSKAGLDAKRLEALHNAWVKAPASSKQTVSHRNSDAAPNIVVVQCNPFPKLCSVNLDIPEQAGSPEDFIVTGELRFARAPDVIDGEPVTVGVRRAVLLPVSKNCYIKPASLYRPPHPSPVGGAEQAIFKATDDEPDAVLDGDQLKGETLGRFVARGEATGGSPEVNVLLQLETANDLRVVLTGDLSRRSAAQIKLAQAWIALQIARTIVEPDGSLRIGACALRWRT